MIARAGLVGLALAALVARHVRAQGTITIVPGAAASAQVAPGGTIVVPVIVDMSAAGGANFASMVAQVLWPSTLLTLESIEATSFGTLASNIGAGGAQLSLFSATGITTTTTVANLRFTALANTAGARVYVIATSAANEQGTSLAPYLFTRVHDVCVAPLSPWGDANGDGAVNIIDAQQIARFSVGLSVANSAATTGQGDVTADGTVNIVDAQQIARFSVALSAAARLGTSASVVPPVASVAVAPANAGVGVNRQSLLLATVLDGAGKSLAGCTPLTWTSSDATKATISADGIATGVATGTSTITATAPNGPAGAAALTVYVPVASVAFAQDTATIHMGEQFQLNATAYDEGGMGGGGAGLRTAVTTSGPLTGKTFVYSTSDPTIATVSSTGLVTALMVGNVRVTATSELRSATATIQVSPLAENSVAASDQITCGLTVTGTAYCWGNGSPGDGSQAVSNVPVRAAVPEGVLFTQISATSQGACAVSTRQLVYCWGNAYSGLFSPTPIAISSTLQLKAVAQGPGFACALDLTGNAHCAGNGALGRLGNGGTASSGVLTPVSGGLTFQRITSGLSNSCGLEATGAAHCWGDNTFRTLGAAGLPANSLVPVPVTGGLLFSSVRVGGGLACGVAAAGAGYCWGTVTSFGQNGAGPPGTLSTLPTPIVGGLVFKTVVPGAGNNILNVSCGLITDGTAYCWGPNDVGGVGSTATLPSTCVFGANTFPCTGVPTPVTTTEKFSTIVSGSGHVCGITLNRAMLCWGRNESGQLGDGSMTNRSTPVTVAGGLRWP